jgi:hypothetical protein
LHLNNNTSTSSEVVDKKWMTQRFSKKAFENAKFIFYMFWHLTDLIKYMTYATTYTYACITHTHTYFAIKYKTLFSTFKSQKCWPCESLPK